MVRSSFRTRSLLTVGLFSFPALALAGACSSSSTPPPAGNNGLTFGDGGNGKPDVTVKKPTKDAGHDSGHLDAGRDGAKDGATDGPKDVRNDALDDAGPATPCTQATECASLVCEPVGLVGKQDGRARFDAAVCGDAGAMCECQTPTCTDGVKNGHETDIDCGGGACPPCATHSRCEIGSQDCAQGECGVGYKGLKCTGFAPDAGPSDAAFDAGLCTCEVPTCSDGVKNEDETDIDCGGSICSKCPTGKDCKQTSDCTSGVCTSGLCACPTGMTEAPTAGSVPYCIDTYEITYKQYSAFVGASTTATLMMQPSECAWNSTFVPSNNWPQVGEEANNPVNYVDWCDALAYCSSVGHHLCGTILNPTTHAPGGQPVPFGTTDAGVTAGNQSTVDEWYNACSSQGQNTWPYSNTYQRTWCNNVDSPAQSTSGFVETPVGQPGYTIATVAPTCLLDTGCNGADQFGVLSTIAQGQVINCKLLAPTMGAMPACGPAFGESGCVGGSSTNIVYDMAGNVAEWENSCSPSPSVDGGGLMSDLCAIRGGSYDSKPGDMSTTCALNASQPAVPRNTQQADIGFRCCL